MSIEYSEETERIVFSVSYGGEKKDITMEADQLVLSVLKGVVGNIEYSYCPEKELKNQLTMSVFQ